MKNVTLTYQNYGTAIYIFIQGKTREDAYGMYLSLYNWGATSSDPNDVAPNTIAVWSTIEKFQAYFFNINFSRIEDNKPAKCCGLMDIAVAAWEKAKAEFEAVARESYRSVNAETVEFEFGTVDGGDEEGEDFEAAMWKFVEGGLRS